MTEARPNGRETRPQPGRASRRAAASLLRAGPSDASKPLRPRPRPGDARPVLRQSPRCNRRSRPSTIDGVNRNSSAALARRCPTGTSPPTIESITSATSGPPASAARLPVGLSRKTIAEWASILSPSSMSRSASVETPTRRRRALSLSRLCTGSVDNRIETTAMTTVYSRVAGHRSAHAALNLGAAAERQPGRTAVRRNAAAVPAA